MQRARIQTLSWNAGGLSSEGTAELEQFLQGSCYAVALIQETHWSSSGEWVKGDWTFIHSASKRPRQDGVMVCIRTSLLGSGEVQWQEIVPGRLLRVRAILGKQQWDLFSLYQHAMISGAAEAKDKLLDKRRLIWRKLDTAVQATPLRSMVLLGGDFNASLSPKPPFVGFGVLQGQTSADLERERSLLNDLFERHKLTVLNSWSRKQATYVHPTGSTQIDFLVVRQQTADGQAKQSGPISVGLAEWRQAGHRLISASLRMVWKPWRASSSPTPTSPAKTPLHPKEKDIAELRSLVRQRCPGRSVRQKLPPLAGVGQEIECHWRLRRRLQQLNRVHILKHAFQAFLLHAQAQSSHRALKRACRRRKRDRLLSGLQQIERAAERGDCKSFHTFVKLVSPKPFVPKIKLRDGSGMTMTKFQEGEILTKYAAKLFHAASTDVPPLLPAPPQLFSKTSWEWAILQVKKGKAVPAGSAQISTWQQSPGEYATRLEAICCETVCCQEPFVPSLWSRVQIAWLPKPGKTPSCPEHLSTIGLMGVETKAFMVILKAEAHPYIMNILQHTPQFAYRSGVSTIDAVSRVGAHCNAVRKELESTSTSHLSRLLGSHVPELVGGLALSLDLSKAFDCLTYAEMWQAMVFAGMPEYLIRLLLHVHMQSVCEIVHGSYKSEVQMKRGLRQGCPVAPIIYSAWTALLCSRLVTSLGEGWDASTMTIFADDKLLCWQIKSLRALERALGQVSVVLDILQQACMKVNITKSDVLMLLRGTKADEARRRFISVRGGEDHLRIPHAGSSVYFAIKSQIRYLGVILSYGSFEMQSATFRCGQAKAAFGQLRAVLRTGSCLSKADRLRIYRACVWTVLEYGLLGVGLDRRALDLVCSTVALQLRKVLRLHEKGISNKQVFQAADIDPAQIFLRRYEAKLILMPETDVPVLQEVRHRLAQAHANLVSIVEAGGCSITPHVADSAVSCPVCGLYFTNELGLNMHIKSSHPQVHDDSRVEFVKARHAVNGIPQCFFCLKMFCDHHSLEKHVTMGGCSVIKTALSTGQTIAALEEETRQRHNVSPPEVPASVRDQQREDVLLKDNHPMFSAQLSDLPAYSDSICAIGSRCILCGQILLDKNRIKTHWRKSHPSAWRQASSEALRICGSLKSVFRSPCQFCSSTAKNLSLHATQCSTLFQVCAGHVLQKADSIGVAEADSKQPQARSSSTTPAYLSSSLQNTPLAAAFRVGAIKPASATFPEHEVPLPSNTPGRLGHAPREGGSLSESLSTRSAPPKGKLKQASILKFAAQSSTTAGGLLQQRAPLLSIWTARLRLRNPHQLCYANSSVTVMLHILHLVGSLDLRPLVTLCKQAADGDRALALHTQLVVRSAVLRWLFNAEQKDASEFLMQYLQVSAATWSRWESRRLEEGALRITDYGGRMLFAPLLEEDRVSLSTVLRRWSQGHSITGVAEEKQALVVQLGRYVQGHKNNTRLDFEQTIEVPTFTSELEQTQRLYMVHSAVVHQGPGPTSGHYRALLRVGHEWGFSDDGVPAQSVALNEHHQRNVYLLLLVPIAQA